ncbi:MAG: nucleoside 2-deoxyribosyltransferase [Candidatus Parcubacteria bacterium]|nr:nucleoside 2-deoxyribosyltransferase [Candidatus Parcubacteria bacterium]
MRIYITSSFGDSEKDIEKLCSIIKSTGFKDFSFIRDIEKYQKIFDNSKDLMKKAEDEIKKSDVLLIDMTDKPTGRAIEAGMAYALGKKIIVIFKKGTQIKDTTRGIADSIIEYDVIEDIFIELKNIFNDWQ